MRAPEMISCSPVCLVWAGGPGLSWAAERTGTMQRRKSDIPHQPTAQTRSRSISNCRAPHGARDFLSSAIILCSRPTRPLRNSPGRESSPTARPWRLSNPAQPRHRPTPAEPHVSTTTPGSHSRSVSGSAICNAGSSSMIRIRAVVMSSWNDTLLRKTRQSDRQGCGGFRVLPTIRTA